MCLFTHFAAGALAGGATGNVYVGAVAGLASHAVLDAIPHYDHPDWRLELGGGLLSLVLLLLLPFSSAAAVVGGICGMLPDLENLFQKLGWMGRDRFVFPSHTGLVPHGRTLGPRSLVWQVGIFVVCFGLLGLLVPGAAQAASGDEAALGRPTVRVLATGVDRTTCLVELPLKREPASWEGLSPDRIRWSGGRTAIAGEDPVRPRSYGVTLAVPGLRAPQILVTGVQWWRRPDSPVEPHELVSGGTPLLRRGVPMAGAEVLLELRGGILRSVTLEFLHPADELGRELLAVPGVEPGDKTRTLPAPPGLLNPELEAVLSRGARRRTELLAAAKADPSSLFELTDNWLRLHLTETGLYHLTGSDLEDLGVPVTDIDPVKLRLYRGGGLQLDDDPEFPAADQRRRTGLNELAVEVLDGGDDEWNLADELRFYGVGTSTWRDRLAPGAETLAPGATRLEHYDHPYADHAVYWLTWEDDAAPSSPLPGLPRRVVRETVPAGAGAVRTSAQVRLHVEQQREHRRGVLLDRWAWYGTIYGSLSESFTLHRPVPGEPARYSADLRATSWLSCEVAAQLNDDVAGRATASFAGGAMVDSLRCRVMGTTAIVQHGVNTFTVHDFTDYRYTTAQNVIALDCFDIMYESSLVLESGRGALSFGLWGDEVTVPGMGQDIRVTSNAEVLLWDVTVPDSARVLIGTPDTDGTTFGLLRDPGLDRHFVISRPGDLQSVVEADDRAPMALKAQDAAVDYVVVAPAAFMDAAGDLADFRSDILPGIDSPRARAVDLQDIYDNFAGGQKDAMAIRDYLRYVYGQGGSLAYACFLGNATSDPRNFRGGTVYEDLVDLVPTVLRHYYPTIPQHGNMWAPWASDDGLVSFESPPDDGTTSTTMPLDLPDLACGRLPALDAAEARDMVARCIAAGRNPEPGAWRNRVMLAADDLYIPSNAYPSDDERDHTDEAELIAENFVPTSLDVIKTFGCDYAFPPGSRGKPAMNRDIVDELNRGTTIFYYVGHGSQDKLGDEGYFFTADIAGVTSGMKRPVFMAFSCDVGVYDSIVRRSMAEEFVAADQGGAAAAVCASEVSYKSSNEDLTDYFFAALFPGREVSAATTLGGSLLAAKGSFASSWGRNNSQRYTIFGDPAHRLPHPVNDLTFATDTGDTLRPGLRQEVGLDPTAPGGLVDAGDSWDLRAEDSAWETHYIYFDSKSDWEDNIVHDEPWIKRGQPAARLYGVLDAADMRIPFKTPTQSRTGQIGRIRLLVGSGSDLRVASNVVPVVRSPLGAVDDLIGPEITLGFEDDRYRVTPGTVLAASLRDTSSIAVLGTAPGNSISLEFDDSGYLVDVTESFVFEAGTHERGHFEFPLPADLELGSHTVHLVAADALGNVGVDSVSFEMVAAGTSGIHDVTLFPNPTPGPCRLIFELVNPMEVRWDIYTVAGRRVVTVVPGDGRIQGPGPVILEWDGRDAERDEMANGTYLYVLRGIGGGQDGRDLIRTGKLVIMR